MAYPRLATNGESALRSYLEAHCSKLKGLYRKGARANTAAAERGEKIKRGGFAKKARSERG
jgi:hypothetical protein